MGTGGELKAGYTMHWNGKAAIVCSLKYIQKRTQCTYQVKMVVGNSVTPHVALLLCPSGTVHPIVNRHRSQK